MNAPTRPVLRYHGGKWRIAEWVISHFPPHRVYVEPFGGAASVLLQKPMAFVEVYNDLDDHVVSLFRILRDPARAEELRRLVGLTPFSRAEHAAAFEVSNDPLEEARRFIIRSFQSLGNKDRCKTNGWRTRTAKSLWSPCIAWNGWHETIPDICLRLRDTIIENMPWQRVCEVYDDPDTLIYLDPPYVRGSRSRDLQNVYAHELTDADHLELLAWARQAKGMVILSGYRHPLYEDGLRGWSRTETKARAQANSQRVEVLWCNAAAVRARHGYTPMFAFEESEVAA